MGPERTPMAEDVREILAQNRMILEFNMKIVEFILHNPPHIVNLHDTLKDDVFKDVRPGSQL